MRPLRHFHQVLSEQELDRLHEAALEILEDPGMRLENDALLAALRRAGAAVDAQERVVRFPRRLVEEAIAIAGRDELRRRGQGGQESEPGLPGQLTFSWHTPFRDRTPGVRASIGGGAPLFYDHSRKTNRYADRRDFLATIRLAEGLSSIATMGNGVHCLKEDDGTDVPPKLVAIEGAALVARHSSKPGCTSIIDRRQLPYLMELGAIVRGSAQAYLRNPILVNIHDTESPLRLTRPEAALIEDMARAGLSIFILPMPLVAISTPVYPIAAAIVAVAEILGVWTAVKALNPDCPVEARCVSGVLNPATGAASFAAPETVLIDLAVAQLFRGRYGVPCGTGVGLIDAPVPGALSIYERTFKAFSAALAGEPAFPAGIIGGAVVFSPEQVLLDLDIAACQAQLMWGIGGEHLAESVALIRARGIGGLHLDSEHTVRHFRDCLQIPAVLPRLKSTEVGGALARDPVELAHRRYREILEANPLREPEEGRAREIDRVLREARRALGSIAGAME
jgi:trimethylamine--corrinoid protein Co-methyltransferase